MIDLVITGGTIVDGTRLPRRAADVAVEGGRVRLLPPDTPAEGHRILDARGLMVAPGFIDMHSHSDWCILYDPQAEARLTQGVTTEVMGKCGYSAAPLGDPWLTWWWTPQEVPNDLGPPRGFGGAMRLANARALLRRLGIEANWPTYAAYLERVQDIRPGVNVVPGVGHNTIRTMVMGLDDRPPTPDELDRMRALVRGAMEAGAFAFSTGLIYAPGRFASTDEVEALCRVVAEYGGHYYTHLRSEADGLLDAIDEAIGIAGRTGVRLEIAHLKALGASNWGKLGEALRRIESAWTSGIPAGVDAYPYTVAGITQSRLGGLLPPSFAGLAREAAFAELDEASARRRASEELTAVMTASEDQTDRGWIRLAGGPGRVVLTRSDAPRHAELRGKTFEEIAAFRGVSPAQAMIDVAWEARGQGSVVFHVMSEEDVEEAVRSRFVGVGSDGHVGLRQALPAWALPHPRNYGTFPRIIARYARDRGILTLEDAIWKMTGLNAERMGLRDRGRVADGCWADLVVFDPADIDDRAAYGDPWATAAGIRWVLVNGQIAVEDGRLTGARAGSVLRRA
ncbi:MAG: N-acyl-D-amino-acid deacylase family protein [Armatimonadota bacterium]